MAKVALQSCGRGLWVSLPVAMARKANLRAGQRVRVKVDGARVVLTRELADLTLERRLARYDVLRHAPANWAR